MKRRIFVMLFVFVLLAQLCVVPILAAEAEDEESESIKWYDKMKNLLLAGDSTESENTELPEETEEAAEYTPVSIVEIYDAYANNVLRWESLYKDKNIEITGKVSSINRDYIDVYPYEDSDYLNGVMCHYTDDSQEDVAIELNVGDAVTVRGKITERDTVFGLQMDIDEIVLHTNDPTHAGNTSEVAMEDIAGVYQMIDLFENGVEQTDAVELMEIMGAAATLHLSADGTGWVEIWGESNQIIWGPDNSITFGDDSSGTWQYDNGLFYYESGSQQMVFARIG